MQIQYQNKSFINKNADIPETNKITDDNMNEIKNVVNENYLELKREIITAVPIQDVSTSSNKKVKIPVEEKIKLGELFTIDNNEIVIGKNISKIIVSANFNFLGETTSYVIVNVEVNGEEVLKAVVNSTNSYLPFLSLSQTMIDVNENDRISINLNSTNSSKVTKNFSNLTIERVA